MVIKNNKFKKIEKLIDEQNIINKNKCKCENNSYIDISKKIKNKYNKYNKNKPIFLGYFTIFLLMLILFKFVIIIKKI